MPPHARQQLRAAVVTALTGLATTGSRVSATRRRPTAEADLPCLVVFTPDETTEIDSMGRPSRAQLRSVVLEVVGFAKGSSLDDALDAIAAEVETALFASAVSTAAGSVGVLVKDLRLVRSETAYDPDAASPVGTLRLVFAASLRTREGAPTVIVA